MLSELKNFPTKLQWQIDRRAHIERLLFDVHSFLKERSDFWQTADEYWHEMSNIVGAAYSLLRSVSLTELSKEREEIQKQTKEFIEKVIHNLSDNSELTTVYYNNNARYRLERIYLHNESLAQLPSFQRIDDLRREDVGDIEKLDQQGLWDDLFKALRDCFGRFKANYN